MKFKLTRGFKQFLIRSGIFLILIYLLIPFILDKTANLFELSKLIQFNYMRMFLFSILLVALFVLFHKKDLFNIEYYLQHKKQTVLFSALSIISFTIYFIFAYIITIEIFGEVAVNLMFLYSSYLIGTILALLAVFNMTFIRKFYKSLIAMFMIAILFFEMTLILRKNWLFFSTAITKFVYFLTNAIFGNAGMQIGLGDPVLSLGTFSVIIGSPCSGVESLAMFSFLFLLILVYDWDILDKKKAAWLFPVGLAGMFLMSVLRIFLLMVVGTHNPELAMSLFHTNLGWILFVVYFLVFFYFAYNYMRKN